MAETRQRLRSASGGRMREENFLCPAFFARVGKNNEKIIKKKEKREYYKHMNNRSIV